MTVITNNSITGINSITAQASTLNFYDSTGSQIAIGASVTGDITGNLTGNVTGIVTATGGSLTGISTVGVTTLTVNGNAYPSAGPLSNRNLIINGAMNVAQRATQVTGVTASDYRTCDRFKANMANLGTWTIDQSGDAPTGFSSSFKMTCTSADASPAANDNIFCVYKIEAQDLQSLAFGTSGAQATTLSFWVRSNKTGNASFAILQNDNSNKLASFQYSISSADTWEHKTITIPGDTAGLIVNDNGEGLQLEWWLNSGSTYTGGSHQATWSTFDNTNRNVSNFGLGGATSDYWQITGVQLELGSVATPFEHRSYGDELARCQRYYWNVFFGDDSSNNTIAQGTNWNGSTGFFNIYPPVAMRTAPSLEASNTASYYIAYENGSSTNVSTIAADSTTTPNVIEFSAACGGTSGNAIIFRRQNASAILRFSAEL